MFKLALALVSLAIVGSTAIGQTSDEANRIRRLLNVPSDTIIVSSSSSKLPAGTPLKIYMATGEGNGAQRRFAQWIEKWNRGEGQRYGTIEVVSDLAQAHLVIARYEGDYAIAPRTSIGTIPGIGIGNSPSSHISKRGTRAYVYRPLYLYLLTRTPDALAIVYRHVDRYNTKDRLDPHGNLLSALKKKMKQR
ncbi:MAG: hypothetical protein WCF57_00155 [Pyrinomonadaceae bacterium]